MLDGNINISQVDYLVTDFDNEFRLNFSELIKETKLNSHKCQYICYKNTANLLEAESCARSCFEPFLQAKKNISLLIEGKKENFEKCKFNSESKTSANSLNLTQIKKCLLKYKEEMESLKDEVEYIYKGYLKNYDSLINKDDKII